MCWSLAVEKMISPSLLYLSEGQLALGGAGGWLFEPDLGQSPLLVGVLTDATARYGRKNLHVLAAKLAS